MFEADSIQDLITFKWDQYGLKFHLVGCIIHLIYMVILFIYTYLIYIKGEEQIDEDGNRHDPYNIFLLLGVLYPALYELVQMCKGGFVDYLTDSGNYIDLVYIWGSIAMSLIHGS